MTVTALQVGVRCPQRRQPPAPKLALARTRGSVTSAPLPGGSPSDPSQSAVPAPMASSPAPVTIRPPLITAGRPESR
ncbi:MAG TPA: hypothetical protein VI365_31180 [Trebonia sp.]